MKLITEKHFAIIDTNGKIVSTCAWERDAFKFIKVRENFGATGEHYVHAWLTFENGDWRFATHKEIAANGIFGEWWQQDAKRCA